MENSGSAYALYVFARVAWTNIRRLVTKYYICELEEFEQYKRCFTTLPSESSNPHELAKPKGDTAI